jgi:membrane protease YdiL (CAAX protease family)
VRSLALVGLIVTLLVVTAAVSPWVAWGMAAIAGHPFGFGRVYHRVFELLLVAALVGGWRRLDLGGLAEIGFTRSRWGRQLWSGVRIGVGGLAVGLGVAILLGGIVLELRYPPMKTLGKVLFGLVGALIVGVGEEALFRGVLLRRFTRDAGRVAAVVLVTVVYAGVHGLRRMRIEGAVDVKSGVAYTLALLGRLVAPVDPMPFFGLLLLGLLLVSARLASGGLWLPIGIHAIWVAVFRVGRLFLDVRPEPRWLVGTGWPPLVGGATGAIAVAVCAMLLGRHVARGSHRS